MDYLEIMDYCSYDVDKAHAMIEELLDRRDNSRGVERVESESPGTCRWRLRYTGTVKGVEYRLGICICQGIG